MPKYRNRHWTDGDGIGPKLKGDYLWRRIGQLRTIIIENHGLAVELKKQAEQGWQGYLEKARLAGDALNEVKRRLGHRLKWSRWRQNNLIDKDIMSRSTTILYMHIARNWNDPKLEAARKEGLPLDSIRKVRAILQGKQPRLSCSHQETSPEQEAPKKDVLRKYLATLVKGILKTLTYDELRILEYNVEELWEEEIMPRVRNLVAAVYGESELEMNQRLRERKTFYNSIRRPTHLQQRRVIHRQHRRRA